MDNNHTTLTLTLPNGARLECSHTGGTNHLDFAEQSWSGLDIVLHYTDGAIQPLCCVDYEYPGESRFGDRLRVLAYREGEEDFVYEQVHPYRRYSIWITLDEDTYDVNVWDEDADARDDGMEICRLETFAAAEAKMEELIRTHPSIAWTKRDLQKK